MTCRRRTCEQNVFVYTENLLQNTIYEVRVMFMCVCMSCDRGSFATPHTRTTMCIQVLGVFVYGIYRVQTVEFFKFIALINAIK